MRKPLSLSQFVRWWKMDMPRARGNIKLIVAVGFLLVSLLASSCSLIGVNAGVATPTPSTTVTSKLTWCGKPSMVFRDEGDFTPTVTATATATATPTPTATTTAKGTVTTTPTSTHTATATPTPTAAATKTPQIGPGTPQTVTDWTIVKDSLGFMVYLPANMPNGTCLVDAQATIHDPIFGGHFAISYLLPSHLPLSISEAPLKSPGTAFECDTTNNPTPTPAVKNTPKAGTPTPQPGPTQVPTELCSGVKGSTSIIISGPGTTQQLQQTFTKLQSDVTWIPATKN